MENDLPIQYNNTQNTTQSSKKKVIVVIILLIIVIGILGGGFALYSGNKQTPSENTSTTTQLYADDGGYFSVEIPKTWDTSENLSKGTTGIGSGQQAVQDIEETQLSYQNDTSLDIQIYKGTPGCPLDLTLLTTVAGFPAAYDPTYLTWTIPTNKAWVTITASYPGSGIRHDDPQNIQDLPTSAEIQQDKQAVMNVLNTLKFKDLSPFKC